MCIRGGKAKHKLNAKLNWVRNRRLEVGLENVLNLEQLHVLGVRRARRESHHSLVVFSVLSSPGLVDSTREARGIAYPPPSQPLVSTALQSDSPLQFDDQAC